MDLHLQTREDQKLAFGVDWKTPVAWRDAAVERADAPARVLHGLRRGSVGREIRVEFWNGGVGFHGLAGVGHSSGRRGNWDDGLHRDPRYDD